MTRHNYRTGRRSSTSPGRKFLPTLLLAAIMVFLFAPAGATLQNLQTGMKAPTFSLRDLSGKSGDLTSLGGQRLTVVIFWSTWSRKSEAALVRMDKLYRQYRDKGLAVIAVNADSQQISDAGAAEIREFVKKLNLTIPVLVDSGLTTFHDYGVIALPSTVVIDKDGIIRYELSGYPLIGSEQLVDAIVATLEGKEPAAAVRVAEGYQPNTKAQRLFNMGKASEKSKVMADSAEKWYRQAAEADAGFALPWLSLGRFHLRKGDAAQAREDFAQALSREPDNVVALCETGFLTATNGKAEEGQALLDKALKLDASYPPCHYYAGYLLAKSGRMAEGMKLFEEAAALDPRNADMWMLKGRMLEENARPQEAAVAYRKALELMLELE